MLIGESIYRRIFNLFNGIVMLLLVIVTLYPLMYIVFASFSDDNMLMAYNGPLVKPLGFSLAAYKAAFANKMILIGYKNTIIVVVFGVLINMTMTSLGAYFLSRKNVMLRTPIMLMIIFTMFFNGGLIPFYFTVKELGLDNNLLALMLPTAINTFNLIILRTGFMAVPDSLEEAARIDGANDYYILFRVVLPLSLPTVAVIALYYIVGNWNAWFNAMIFLKDRSLYPLQLILQEILIQDDTQSMTTWAGAGDQQALSVTIKYAVIIISTLPVLLVYPFLQKYFVKGVMIGAVKE